MPAANALGISSIAASCKKFYCFTAVPLDYRIIHNKKFNPFRTGKGAEYTGCFCCKEQEKPCLIERSIIQKPIVGILGNSLLSTFGVQESEKIPALKY